MDENDERYSDRISTSLPGKTAKALLRLRQAALLGLPLQKYDQIRTNCDQQQDREQQQKQLQLLPAFSIRSRRLRNLKSKRDRR